MSEYKCEDCKDTKEIEVESVSIGRPYWHEGKLAHDIIGHNDWHKAQCHCVGEDV